MAYKKKTDRDAYNRDTYFDTAESELDNSFTLC